MEGDRRAEDRPMAYVWADVLAERGYRQSVVLRAHHWAQTSKGREGSVAQRERTLRPRLGGLHTLIPRRTRSVTEAHNGPGLAYLQVWARGRGMPSLDQCQQKVIGRISYASG